MEICFNYCNKAPTTRLSVFLTFSLSCLRLSKFTMISLPLYFKLLGENNGNRIKRISI